MPKLDGVEVLARLRADADEIPILMLTARDAIEDRVEGMAEAPRSTSTQYSVMYSFASSQTAGTMVHIETEAGEDVLTFVPTKQYQSVLLSLPELINGLTYIVYSGGRSSGTVTEGLYSGGTYTPGTRVASLTISSMVTGAGSPAGGFPGGPGGPDGRP